MLFLRVKSALETLVISMVVLAFYSVEVKITLIWAKVKEILTEKGIIKNRFSKEEPSCHSPLR